MPRDEDISWAKGRAFELLDLGRTIEAGSSFTSDMNKGDAGGMTVEKIRELQALLIKDDPDAVRKWIEDFK